jgi:para-aminobenzoate synthetase component 1
MKRIFSSFPVVNYAEVKNKLLEWTATFKVGCFLDNHNYTSPYHSYDCLAAAGCSNIFNPDHDFFASLSKFQSETDWIFGHFNYDLFDMIEKRNSNKKDLTGFIDAFLFVPETVVLLNEETITIGALQADAKQVFNEISEQKITASKKFAINFKSRVQKEEFISVINKLKEHINYGDCYEINYCQEFYAEGAYINSVDVYRQLTEISPNPFSCFYKLNDKFVLCASPERYLKKMGSIIISQPVKGTFPRDIANKHQDEINKHNLKFSEKDKKENVIVVDLVRNDLSKVCEAGTVAVEELYGIYSFPNVHQMISTVSGKLKPQVGFSNIIEATFPMGSMTGAPKKRVMELLEKYEYSKRGVYSGTIGYISPEKDFDFNVVIRSIVYNKDIGYISYHTGAGITAGSDAYMEYEECLVKAAAVFKVFGNR